MKPFVSLKMAAESKIAGISKETNFQVDPALVEIEPGFNRPISRENVEQFKLAIKSGATIPPIFVNVDAGRIIMVDGEHRLIAVKELIAEGVEIKSMSATQFRGNDADRVAHLLTSAQGRPLTPLEAGLQYKKLRGLSWDSKTIANRIGRTVSHVDQCMQLADANSDVHEAIKNKDVSSTEALKVVRKHGSAAGKVIADAKANQPGSKKVKAKTGPTRKALEELAAEVGNFRDSITTVAGLLEAYEKFRQSF